MQEYIALAVFAIVYALIVCRRRFGVPIWAAMLIGAALMVAFQVVGVSTAFASVNLDVIAFLFGMFSIVAAMDRAGVLQRIALKMLSLARTPNRLLFVFVAGMGLLAAFAVNDTIALLAIPLVVYIAKHSGIRPAVLFIALAFGITIGSTMTPIGNPQNLLIAIQSGIASPFVTFVKYLAAPTAVNLLATYGILRILYRKEIPTHFELSSQEMSEKMDANYDPRLAKISVGILIATVAGFVVSELIEMVGFYSLNLSSIAMIGGAAVYALSSRRIEIMKRVDYSILIFFAAMFVVTGAMWQSGAVSKILLGHIPQPDPGDLRQSAAVISAASIGVSQVLSNVPFVALYDPVLTNAGIDGNHVGQWMMLAAASTIAGNLTVLGAASNVIIIEAAESRRVSAFSFVEFTKAGCIVTAANIVVYYVFIVFL